MKNYHLTNVLFFSSLPILGLVGGIAYVSAYGLNWFVILIFLGMLVATLMSITGGYHRLYAHRTYDAAPWLKVVYLLLGAAAFQESCLKWSSEHRAHHKYVDTDKDPYNIKRGFFWAHIGWILSKEDPKCPHPKDLTDDALVMWQYKYWLPLAIITCFGVPTLIGAAFGDALGGFLFGGVIRLVVAHHFTFMINSLAHTIGSQPYSDSNTARDSWITSLFTFGEGYHNYHHWYARDYRNGIRFYHWDPSKWFVRVMEWLGQTWGLKRAPEEVVVKARLQMDRKRIERLGEDSLRLRAEELFNSLMKQMDDMSAKRREWVQAKKEESSKRLDENLVAFRKKFKEARRQYRETYRAWRVLVRQLKAHPAVA